MIKIHYKSSNSLINEIKKQENIKLYKEPNSFLKIFKKPSYPDIFFHSGNLDEKSLNYINNSKITITNSFSNRSLILQKSKKSEDDIRVIYPSANLKSFDIEKIREKYKERYLLTQNTKLILFNAKNFKTSGIKEFLNIASSLSFIDFKLLILGDKQQISILDFILTKYKNLENKVIKLDISKENIDEIYFLSDIFLLPTYNKNIASSIVKAMASYCVVFTTMNNDAKELIDVYATMEQPEDPSTPFKIDAVLYDEKELENIKAQNREIVKELSLEKNIDKFNEILANF